MPVTRHNADFNHVENWTDSILEIPNISSFIKSRNMFTQEFVNTESVIFDRIEKEVTLLPDSDRRSNVGTYGKRDEVDTYALPLSYFNHQDAITKQDYMSKRRAGTPDQEETKASVMTEKLVNGRNKIDQTHEYMMLQAIKGNTTTPSGTVLANMFTEFNVTQLEVDFLLGTSTTNINEKINEVKRNVAKNIKTGGGLQAPLEIIVDNSFFQKLISHANVEQYYINSISNSRYREDLTTYMEFGIMNVFEHQGVRFVSYDHTFNLPNGTTEDALSADEGYTMPKINGASIYRAYYGPSQRMDSEGGAEMFAWEYVDPRGKQDEIEIESAPLFIITKPLASVRVTTSN